MIACKFACYTRYVLCLTVLLLKVNFSAFAQPLRFKHFTVEEGLQNNMVLTLTHDKKGFIWLGTATGIDRFDGNRFSHYKLPAADKPSGLLSAIPYLAIDAANGLWAASNTQVYYYNEKTDKFEGATTINRELKNQSISTFQCFGNNIWIGFSNSLWIYNITDKTFRQLNYKGTARSLFLETNGMLWIGKNKGLELRHFNGRGVGAPIGVAGETQVSGRAITGISKDGEGRYWIVSDKKLFICNDLKKPFTQVVWPSPLKDNYSIKDIYHAGKDATYIAFDGGGLLVVNEQLQKVKLYQTNEDDPTTLSSNGVYNIYKDNFNRLWVTTYGGGINLVQSATLPFTNFYHELNNDNSLTNNMAKAAVEDRVGNIWFGTRKGINIYKKTSGLWQHLNSDNNKIIQHDNILSLACDAENWVWAGTYGGGLLQITQGGTVVQYKKDSSNKNSLGSDYVYTLLADSRNRIWAGGIRGPLSFYDKNTGVFTQIPLNAVTIDCIIENSKREIVVGADKNVLIINDALQTRPLLPGKSLDRVLSMLEYQPGEYWIGTLGGGLVIVDEKKGILKKYTMENGLPSDIICAIQKDRNGDVWISTSKGIVHYFKQQNDLITYTKADGIAGSQFNYGASCQLRSGSLIFGSTNGFTLFDPVAIKTISLKPNLYFTGFYVDNKLVSTDEEDSPLKRQIDALDKITLKYFQRSFAISFTNTAPEVAGKHLYSWKLAGVDKNWTAPGDATTASYANLDNGSYRLMVRSFSKAQPQNISERSITINILPPWWRTLWAYLAYLLLISAAIFAFYNYYQVIAARKRFAERLKLNTSISHEIRTPLTLIKGPVLALSQSPHLTTDDQQNLQLAKRNIEKLDAIISQFIDYQKSGTGKMQMQVIEADIAALVKEKVDAFVPLAKEKGIQLHYKQPAGPISLLYDKDKMEKILNNLVSNAVKYTPRAGSINIALLLEEKDAVITVTDTGIGIPQAQQASVFKGYYRGDNTINLKETGSGIGLNLVHDLVALHKGKISFTSGTTGTSFTIKLPLQNTALEPFRVAKHLLSGQDNPLVPVQPTVISTTKHQNILIAEDNDELRAYLQKTLVNAGYEVMAAPDGKAALEQVQKKQPDLVITDAMMPHLDGFQLCSHIKNDLKTCHIPVVMLTAIHDKDYLLEGYRSGADDYIKKPFDFAYLHTRIENLLQNRTRFRQKIMSVFDHQEPTVAQDADIQWLKNATTLITDNLTNPQFSVEKLASMLATSRPVLFRKFKALASESPQQFISQVRMRKAVEMLQQKIYTVNDVAFECGFADAKYFSTAFKKHFGKTPTEYIDDVVNMAP